MSHQRFRLSVLAIVAASIATHAAAADPGEKVLVVFGGGFFLKPPATQDATLDLVRNGGTPVLQVSTGHKANWPGITIKPRNKPWDLSGYSEIALGVKNVGSEPVSVCCRVDSPGGDGIENSVTENITLKPDQAGELTVTLRRQLPAALAEKLFGMRGYPGGAWKEKGIDTANVTQLIIFVNKPTRDHCFQLTDIRARGTHAVANWLTMPPDEFFPMIDRFGQFVHKDWPGKVQNAGELAKDIERERAELRDHPGPVDWNQFGGWKNGPKQKATGFFYPEKYRGKWWLVDPEGCLFWSHGVDCVGVSQSTPITDREFCFAELPAKNSPLARFYGKGSWAPHGYYKGKSGYRTFDFFGANLMRKYGEDWRAKAAITIHSRLRSWSMNTIANWSDSSIYLIRKTPYFVSAGSGGSKPISGSTGYWGKFPDPFDPSFRQALDKRMHGEKDRSAGDPWCIGYFVDNELAWGAEFSLASATLASPPDQAAKKAFLVDLKDKYRAIDKLNRAWGTDHTSWAALAECRTPPDETKAKEDLGAFATRIAEEYFRNCREAVKAVAPNNLYLGCRFAWVNDRGARAAAKYCDVIGYNLYRDSVAEFKLPDGLDKPVIIGEFHFGALDRGMFHTGLRPTANQAQRASAYRNYVTGALKNPFFVGTHWFQYADQATTGRGDGENYQIGLVNICDRPYPETIDVVREIGNTLYRVRMGN